MIIAIVTSDIMSALFMTILLFGTLSISKKWELSSNTFVMLTILTIIGAWSDAVSYFVDGVVRSSALVYFLNLASYLSCIVSLVLFAVYVLSILSETTDASFRTILPAVIIEGLNILLVLVGTALGKVFTVVEYSYVPDSWDLAVGFLSLLGIASLYLVIFRHRKFLSAHQFTALCSYMIAPVIVILVQFLLDNADFTYAALSAAILLIFVEIQYTAIHDANIREKVLNELSKVDALTGLGNRRAYDEALKKERRDRRLGVGFFDLNQLKYTNDNFGHAAGDQILVRFSEMLKAAFPDGELFRISGDEFTALFEGMAQEDFDRRMEGFYKDVSRADRIAAFGYVYQDGGNLLDMIRRAEKAMYHDKAAFYKETGIDRRK